MNWRGTKSGSPKTWNPLSEYSRIKREEEKWRLRKVKLKPGYKWHWTADDRLIQIPDDEVTEQNVLKGVIEKYKVEKRKPMLCGLDPFDPLNKGLPDPKGQPERKPKRPRKEVMTKSQKRIRLPW